MKIANKKLAQTFIQSAHLKIKRLLALAILPALLFALVFLPAQTSEAASGGRIGGGSFRSPSIPRTGGYRGSYGGGGYGRGYRGGGIGFPFILPIFGFGGGGLFGFLILMAVAGVIVNSIRGANISNLGNSNLSIQNNSGPISIIQIQLGLLASAKALQEDLRRLAESSDTSNSLGLQKVLQETTLSLLRQPELWVYSNIESGDVPFQAGESTFNRLSINERSKLISEITSNVSGQKKSETIAAANTAGEAGETNEFIAVTVLVASKTRLNLKKSQTNEGLQDDLRVIGAITANDLIALEVIWQPEGQGDVLTAEELVTAYPNLIHL